MDAGEGGGAAVAGLALGERIADTDASPVGDALNVAAREGLGEDDVRDAEVAVVVATGDDDGDGDAVPPQAVRSVTTRRATFRDSMRRITFRFSGARGAFYDPWVLVARRAPRREGGTADKVASG